MIVEDENLKLKFTTYVVYTTKFGEYATNGGDTNISFNR